MDLRDFHYDLPRRLIAQHPSEQRDQSRLMILDRRSGRIKHSLFYQIVENLLPGDLILVNNTKVIKARLSGEKETGGKAEVLLTKRIKAVSSKEEVWECLVRSSKKSPRGTVIRFHPGLTGEVLASGGGVWTVRLRSRGDFSETLEATGHVPLPPYIKRSGEPDSEEDRERYQTIFAEQEGAIAAPTAGLHFTPSLVSEIERLGVSILSLTLHIGIGTFRPVRTPRIEEHRMHEETFHIPPETAEAINRVKAEGGRVVAVGTSTTRAIESSVDTRGRVRSGHGKTDLFIYPPFRFRVVDVLLTNFHLPGSTLIMLVSAFATRDLVFKAYREAISRGYRFYSYGDAMMIV
ncbi:MAG: tRNA preQ1(34) S-adenosylmethionine ribosyltransferase-isomerase QueA [Deltaproteobacteria bacterium]|nr:tRNA preQ1(34) S-adenosylmethionine ribosyltransferase-isomerase QueA [Deltaproteobacteria bacterium]MBW2123093.1 tRNA preQ1(34) S-adenosylmethionine ribosyltransferase-isomerase QueA [Deltaproteobacteria bacterium]